MNARSILIACVALALTACSTQVTRPSVTEQPKPVIKALNSFSVEMSPEAKSQLPENMKFDTEAFSPTLKRTLDAHGLIAPAGDFRLKVVVRDIRVRSTLNAIMWGFMAGDDHISGAASIFNRDDKPIYDFQVTSSYALGGIAGGVDQTRLTWLYEDFSKTVAEELAGKRDSSR